jgi:hypothetical protein
MTKTGLASASECIAYVKSLGYDLIGRMGARYFFRDNTGNRPPHCKEMVWSLNEMRHAIKFGC